MADNLTIKDAAGVTRTVATKDIGNVHHPRNILTTPAGADVTPVDSTDFGVRADAPASDDTGSFSFMAFVKRMSGALSSLNAKAPSLSSGRVPVQATPTVGTLVDRSGTVATGGTAQQLMPANPARLGWAIQNLSSADLWVNGFGTAAAAQPSLKIAAGVYYESPPGGQGVVAVSVIGATTGQAFSAREW